MKKIPLIHNTIIYIFLLSVFLLTGALSTSSAQISTPSGQVMGEATLGIARLVYVNAKNVPDGSIISSFGGGPKLADRPYDSQVLGVVSRNAAIILNSGGGGGQEAIPVVANGQVYVRVSSKNGTIKKGDLLTTSTTPGVAIKADKDGYVLGGALEPYVGSPSTIGTIALDLNLHYFNSKPTMLGTLTDILKLALLPTKEGPSSIFKYIVAATVAIVSFVLTFMTFGRTAAKGVEALGRNPSASGLIHLGIIFNITISVAITLVGLIVAFLILRL